MPFKLESNLHIHFSLFWYDRVLRSEGHGLMITVAIRWQIQQWFPELLKIFVRNPLLLQESQDLFVDPVGKPLGNCHLLI